MFKKIFKKIVPILPQIIASLFLVGFMAYAWTGPASPPPEGNVPAPLNVGSAVQTKVGGLNIGGNLEIAGTVKITGGSPAVGKVLISDASGVARWGGVPGVLYGSCTMQLRQWFYSCGRWTCSNWCTDTFSITSPAVQVVAGSDCIPGYKSKSCGCQPATDYDVTLTGSSSPAPNYYNYYYSCKAK